MIPRVYEVVRTALGRSDREVGVHPNRLKIKALEAPLRKDVGKSRLLEVPATLEPTWSAQRYKFAILFGKTS